MDCACLHNFTKPRVQLATRQKFLQFGDDLSYRFLKSENL
jgi:hypothetical protein